MSKAEKFITSIQNRPSSYCGQDFDDTQCLANLLTDEDREAGRPAPFAGYSSARFAEAAKIVECAKQVRSCVFDSTR